MALYLLTTRFWDEVMTRENFATIDRKHPNKHHATILSKIHEEVTHLRAALHGREQCHRGWVRMLLGLVLYFFTLAFYVYLLFFTLFYIAVCPQIPKLSFVIVLLFLLSSSRWAFVLSIIYMCAIVVLGGQADCAPPVRTSLAHWEPRHALHTIKSKRHAPAKRR